MWQNPNCSQEYIEALGFLSNINASYLWSAVFFTSMATARDFTTLYSNGSVSERVNSAKASVSLMHLTSNKMIIINYLI